MVIDSIIGHAIGDAMGVPTEFMKRKELLRNPVVKMMPNKKMKLPAGTWSDDTSMEIATIDSFIQNGYFDYDDIMYKWCEWLIDKKYTATNEVFDVGITSLMSIKKYLSGLDTKHCGLKDKYSYGNGSLMRMLPIALYSYYKKLNDKEIIELTNEMSSLTHNTDICKLGCYIYVSYVIYLLKGLNKFDAYRKIKEKDYSMYSKKSIKAFKRILKDNLYKYKINEINSTGYIVDTLECSLWVILNTSCFKEAIIVTTNVGDDTDTIGAITGSIAGIIYSVDNIPKDWLRKLKKKEYLLQLSKKFETKLKESYEN